MCQRDRDGAPPLCLPIKGNNSARKQWKFMKNKRVHRSFDQSKHWVNKLCESDETCVSAIVKRANSEHWSRTISLRIRSSNQTWVMVIEGEILQYQTEIRQRRKGGQNIMRIRQSESGLSYDKGISEPILPIRKFAEIRAKQCLKQVKIRQSKLVSYRTT